VLPDGGRSIVEVIDVQGRIVRTTAATGKLTLDVAELPNGIYTVRCTSDGTNKVGRFVKE